MRHLTAALLALALAGCAVPELPDRRDMRATDLPPMRVFDGNRTMRPARANTAIARDFLDLTFELESGRAVPTFTRFEGPISLRVLGEGPASLDHDLDRLLDRLRREARIEISRVEADRPANITIETVPRAEMQRAVPAAACFVVPRTADWDDFRANRRSAQLDWTTLETRRKVAIFVPRDVAPQEVRDCLHEELAQALGPLNDLWRLDDSVFNDDNFHTVLTGFDLLILRATYAGELQSGMNREQVARALPAILAQLNPKGRHLPDTPRAATPRDWIDAIDAALGPRGSDASRREAAARAVTIAHRAGWKDNREAFALFALGRLSLTREPTLALGAFLNAASLYANNPATAIHEAHIAMQLAAFSLGTGRAETAIAIVDASTDAAARAENAALLSTLLLVKAEALEEEGRAADAAALRRDGLGWARYGFGSENEVRRRAAEIASIAPRNRIETPS